MNYFLDAFKQYAEFSGRASRQQYWMFFLFYLIIYIILSVIDSALGTFVLSTIYAIAAFIPSISIAARRLHDTGKSGWWQLIVLIPVLGLIGIIFLLAQAGQADNEYGSAVIAE